MTNLKFVSTPLASHYKLSDEQSPKKREEQCYICGLWYVNLVGFVMYDMVCTRLGITYAECCKQFYV